jgi:hypothetical protein
LNSIAFDLRREAMHQIEMRMKVRNPSFVSHGLRVQKSRFGSLASQHAVVGSVPGKNFDGWRTSEDGGKLARNRYASLVARGGSEAGKVPPKYRLKGDIPSEKNVDRLPAANRAQAMIRQMDATARGKPFILSEKGVRGTGWSPGLYKTMPGTMTLPGGRRVPRVRLLQRFGRRPKVKVVHWMRHAKEAVMQRINLEKIWEESIKRALGGGR